MHEPFPTKKELSKSEHLFFFPKYILKNVYMHLEIACNLLSLKSAKKYFENEVEKYL